VSEAVEIKAKYIGVGLLTLILIAFGSYGVYLVIKTLSRLTSDIVIYGAVGIALLLIFANMVGAVILETLNLYEDDEGEQS
jgi:hypothetical protein